jgi:tripartite-type tricarboxylate transporter receptor subunit TctC
MRRLRAAWTALATAPALIFGLAVGDARAAFPEKDITWIVPFAPGGGYDAWSRQIAVAMQKYLPQGVSVVVKNVSGAGGRTGSITLYRARPDGYTIGLLDVAGLSPYQKAVGVAKAGFDVDKYVWIGRVANEPWVLYSPAKSPLKSLEDLKARKDLSWGIEGVGSTKWLFSILEARGLGLPMRFVSGYGGTGELIPASLRGDFDVWTNAGPSAIPYVKQGEMRALLQFGEQRMPAFADVPTAKELGHDIVAEILRLVAAPPGTPAEIAKTLEDAFLKAMNDPDFKAWVVKSEQETNPGGQKEAAAAVANFNRLIEPHMKELAEGVSKQ